MLDVSHFHTLHGVTIQHVGGVVRLTHDGTDGAYPQELWMARKELKHHAGRVTPPSRQHSTSASLHQARTIE
jgi:hypothetical protein